jgi:hypothetical protein
MGYCQLSGKAFGMILEHSHHQLRVMVDLPKQLNPSVIIQRGGVQTHHNIAQPHIPMDFRWYKKYSIFPKIIQKIFGSLRNFSYIV